MQTQILSKYSLYALYDVVPVYRRTGPGCLTTTVGAGGVAAGTTIAEDCPVPAPAGSCDVGGAPVDVTTLAAGTTFVSTIGGTLDKGTPKLTNVDRVSVPKATTGTDAATLLGGADIMPLGRWHRPSIQRRCGAHRHHTSWHASRHRHGWYYIPLGIRQASRQVRHYIK